MSDGARTQIICAAVDEDTVARVDVIWQKAGYASRSAYLAALVYEQVYIHDDTENT